MTLQALPLQTHCPLFIEKNFAEYEAEIKKLAALAWQIAYTALWNTLEFSEKEKQYGISFITDFLQQARSHTKAYADFVQRIILVRQHLISHGRTFTPVPSQWFSKENKKGFAATGAWLEALKITRASLPQYKVSVKAFAEAVLETVETNAAKDFHYWRSYFIQNNSQGLLNLFLSTIANCQNSIQKLMLSNHF